MTVTELRATMKARGVTVAEVARGCGYSYGFASRMLNSVSMVENLPVRIRRTLEAMRLIEAVVIPPTEKQMAVLARLGCSTVPTCRSEASAMIDRLLQEQKEMSNQHCEVCRACGQRTNQPVYLAGFTRPFCDQCVVGITGMMRAAQCEREGRGE